MAAKMLKIAQTYYIRASPEKVFRAISTPSGLTSWLLEKAKISAEKGGTYKFQWIGGYGHEGKVLDIVKDKRLSLAWPAADGKTGMTKATFTLKKRGAMTVVHVDHTGFGRSEAWLQMYAGTQSGWAYYMMNLKSVLENHKDLRHPEDDITS